MKKKAEALIIPLTTEQQIFFKKIAPRAEKKVAAKKGFIPVEPHFKPCCGVWIEVYGNVVPPPPGEKIADPKIWKDKVEMRHLKLILKDLRKRAEEKNIEWTEEAATTRFRAFVTAGGNDEWISKNFLLRILNNNKTKIFNNQITPKKDGRTGANGYAQGQSTRNNDYRAVDEQSGTKRIDGSKSADTKGGFGQL
jgi:hypothetical protein